MAKRFTLTPACVDALTDGNLLDPQTPGLSIEAGTNGKRTWRYRRRITSTDVVVKLVRRQHQWHRFEVVL